MGESTFYLGHNLLGILIYLILDVLPFFNRNIDFIAVFIGHNDAVIIVYGGYGGNLSVVVPALAGVVAQEHDLCALLELEYLFSGERVFREISLDLCVECVEAGLQSLHFLLVDAVCLAVVGGQADPSASGGCSGIIGIETRVQTAVEHTVCGVVHHSATDAVQYVQE